MTGGSVTIDGVDVRDVTLASLRRQIGVVLQDTFLFSDTVMNNIRYGRPEASDEEVIAAAKLARADEFIEQAPNGYETVLGERGAGLSQGQRQLLSIARAAHRRPAPAHPRRGHQQRRHAHRTPDPGGARPTAGRAHELRDRPPPEHDPQRQPGAGRWSTARSSSAAPTRNCWPRKASTTSST